jgi:choice-of-anchor C domain-containing protein
MNLKKSLNLALLLTALSLGGFVTSAYATPITIQNGSFETGVLNNAIGFDTKFAPSADITNWMVTAGSVDYIGGYWQPGEGKRSLDMNGLSVGTIQQQINVPTTGNVTIDFLMAGNPDDSFKTKSLTVSLISGSEVFTFNATGKTLANMGWTQKTATFNNIAAGNWFLRFQGDTTNIAWGPALDNISASVDAPVSVPDGGVTASLLGLGLTGLGLLRRRFRA